MKNKVFFRMLSEQHFLIMHIRHKAAERYRSIASTMAYSLALPGSSSLLGQQIQTERFKALENLQYLHNPLHSQWGYVVFQTALFKANCGETLNHNEVVSIFTKQKPNFHSSLVKKNFLNLSEA